ncbi:hypothetical protein D3C84_1150860 [compost metagenome]
MVGEEALLGTDGVGLGVGVDEGVTTTSILVWMLPKDCPVVVSVPFCPQPEIITNITNKLIPVIL